MEQLVARWAHNPKVVGSSPAPATKNRVSEKRESDERHSVFYLGILPNTRTFQPLLNIAA